VKRTLALFFILLGLPSLATAADLIVEKVWQHSPVIVYELPEAEDRADAVRYVESIRDELKKGSAVLDASANDSSLERKLKGGFILYTTLGEKSKLLRLATSTLGWELAGGSFHFRDLTTPAGELKLILVGKNPYSHGYCLIYAAGSNRALAGINGLDHGTSSYSIYRGSRLLREGNYDENFIPRRERISKAAALEDMNQFFKTLRRVHPNLLRSVTEDSYRELKAQTAAGITGKLDSKGELPVEELASLLYYAAAYFKDGHNLRVLADLAQRREHS